MPFLSKKKTVFLPGSLNNCEFRAALFPQKNRRVSPTAAFCGERCGAGGARGRAATSAERCQQAQGLAGDEDGTPVLVAFFFLGGGRVDEVPNFLENGLAAANLWFFTLSRRLKKGTKRDYRNGF